MRRKKQKGRRLEMKRLNKGEERAMEREEKRLEERDWSMLPKCVVAGLGGLVAVVVVEQKSNKKAKTEKGWNRRSGSVVVGVVAVDGVVVGFAVAVPLVE